ncbi:reverse transcriptase domain-containing protein [Clostridium sporogenes]
MQRKLAYILNLVYKVKPSAYGFIQDRGIKDNAINHTKRKLLLNIDLKDFFSQVHFGRVRGMLMKKPYGINQEAATVIAQLVCFEGALPQGAPSSPIITNMICSPLDTQLIRLAKKYGLVYTRYADDITFSTNNQFPKEIITEDLNKLTIGSELNSILKKIALMLIWTRYF